MTGIDTGRQAIARAYRNLDHGDEFTAADLRAILNENAALREKLEAAEAGKAAYRDMLRRAEQDLTEARADQAAAWEALETLQFIRDSISDSITSNEEPTHRIELDGVWHTGPVVDWAHKVLTGLRDISGHALSKHRALTPPADLSTALQAVKDAELERAAAVADEEAKRHLWDARHAGNGQQERAKASACWSAADMVAQRIRALRRAAPTGGEG